MKTLKQILENYCSNKKEDCLKLDMYCWECLLTPIRLWLQQNKNDIGNQIYSDSRVVAETVFDVLLGELTVSSKEG